jgi:NAD+ kinase
MKIYYNDKRYYALNEVVVQRIITGNFMAGITKLSLNINNQFVDKYNVDGLIISTPTGSTAYSLSAGGSILTPELSAFIATPVCPHSLHNRPIVYPDTYQAKITVNENSNKTGLFVDGKFVKELKSNDTVTVLKSRRMVKFYKSNEQFFEKLLIKLNKWSETK